MNTHLPLNLQFNAIAHQAAPLWLLLEADPSESMIMGYLTDSIIVEAKDDERLVGIYVLKEKADHIFELMNIAVIPELQGKGYGKLILSHALESAKNLGGKMIRLGTGTFGYQVSFYQKAGFQVDAVEKNYFIDFYDQPVIEDGLQHRDRLILSREL